MATPFHNKVKNMSKPNNPNRTIAVDFDGVLHSYTSGWKGPADIPDPPVPGAIEWLNKISPHFEVVIFTTRGESIYAKNAIRQYLYDYGWTAAKGATVTNTKIPAIIYIDDRGWRFEGEFPSKEEIHRAKPWNKQ